MGPLAVPLKTALEVECSSGTTSTPPSTPRLSDHDGCWSPARKDAELAQAKWLEMDEKTSSSHEVAPSLPCRSATSRDVSLSVQERLRERVLVACLIMFAEGFTGTQFYPYGPWMVQELRGTSEGVGLYTGLLSTARSSGGLLTAYFWASYSNRRGRRLCLLIGLVAGLGATGMQAFTRNYWVVAFLRFLSGLLNSNLSIMRTVLRESFQHERSEDTWAFSTLSVAFSASCMAGPSLGGLMYGKELPLLGGVANPWSGAMLTCTAIYITCIVFTWRHLPETAFLASQEQDLGEVPIPGEAGAAQAGSLGRGRGQRGGAPLLHDANFLLILVMGGFHSYVFTGWEVVYPLLARLPLEQLGEQWSAAQIGFTFLVGSLGLCLYSLACYPWVVKRLSVVRFWWLSWVVPLLVMPAFPRLLTAACAAGWCDGHSAGLVDTLNYVAQLAVSVLLGSGFISIQVILNSYVSTRPDATTALALANSLLVTMQSLARAASPVVTGSLFALGLGEEGSSAGWALTRALPFDSLAAAGFVACLLPGLAFEARTTADSACC